MNITNKRLLRLLLVSGDENTSGATRRLLGEFQENRCEISWVRSPRTALKNLKKGGHDVCLLDDRVGKRTGLSLLHEAIRDGCRTPIILLTEEADENNRLEAVRAGAAYCLAKAEINAPLLERAIGYAVGRGGELNGMREEANKYRKLVEMLPVMIYAAEPQPPYSPIYVSPAFEAFGYSLEEWNSCADLWLRLLHPEDSERILGETEAMMNAGRETDLEYRVIAKNGAVHWVHDRGHFVRDEKGKPICWQGVILDITTRKCAEEESQRREKLYLTLARNIPNTSVLLFDRDFRYSIAEVSADNSYGFAREHIEGKTLWEIFPPNVCAEWAALYDRALAGETISVEREVNGKLFQAYVVPVKNQCGETFAGMVLWQDMTERRESEKALRESEAHFKSAFEDAAVGMAIASLDGRWIQVNQQLSEMLGYTKEELTDLRFAEITHPDDLQEDSDSKVSFIASKARTHQGEKRYIHKNGNVVWAHLNVSLIKDENDEPKHFIAQLQDITERKLAVEALRESEERYREIFENANDLIYVHDLEGNYLSINKATERVIGYTLEEALRLNMRQVVVPEHFDYSRRQLADKLAGGAQQTVYETDCITKDGERVTLEINSNAIYRDGAVVAVQGIARDITERKRAEAALKEREEQYRELFENANDLIFTRDLRGNFTSLNRTGEVVTGYSREEVLNINSKEIIAPDYLEKAQAMISRIIAGEPSPAYELVVISKQNERIPVELSMRLITKDGKPVGIQGIARDITERKRTENLLQISEAKLKDLFDNAPLGYHELDNEGRIVRVNHTELEMFGYTREEMLGRFVWEFVVESVSRDAVLSKLSGKAALESHERTFRRRDGSLIPILIQERLIEDADGNITGLRSTLQDITERRVAEKAIVDSERRYRSLGEGVMHQVWTAQPNGKIDYINSRTLKYFGRTHEEMSGEGWQALVHPEDLAEAVKRWNYSIETGEDYETEFRLRRYNGEYCWHQARATAEFGADGEVVKWFGTNTDINARKIAEAKLRHIAGHDVLTNLPNRTKFMNHLERAVSRAEHNRSFRFAVLFLDLDRFKIINDSLGHNIGDKLLIAFAKKIEECLRPNDIVARLGGDEFTILLCGIKDAAAAVRVAERILEKLSAPFMLDAYEVFTSASIGIIVSDKVKRQPEDFLRDADTAMYRAKAAGKSRYEIFDREMHLRNMNLLQMENDLRRAIERDEFRVFYQPIIELATGKIREFEALIRWQHPQHGMVPPNEFITIAEETGLIIPIGRWILEEAARQTAEWQKRFPHRRNLSISVNLSAKQLMHPHLIAQVGEILEKTRLDARHLKLEVTESMVMENSDQALTVISELNTLGIQLSTDDFGTGYSSLSYLHRFPFNRLKIDRSFVSKMDSDQKSEAIVRTILLLAQNLNIEVVAEGIETEPQLRSLRQLGCKTGQGYFFSKPVTAEVAAQLLQNGLQNDAADSFYSFGETENHQLLELDKIQ